MPDEWHPELTTASRIKPVFPKVYLGPPKGSRNGVHNAPPEIVPNKVVQLMVHQHPGKPHSHLSVHEIETLAMIGVFDVLALVDAREFECLCECRRCQRGVPRTIRKRVVKVNTHVVETNSDDNHAGGNSPRTLEEMIQATLERIEEKVQRNRNNPSIRIENKDSLIISS